MSIDFGLRVLLACSYVVMQKCDLRVTCSVCVVLQCYVVLCGVMLCSVGLCSVRLDCKVHVDTYPCGDELSKRR